jgi:hypothetical protein
MGLSRFQVDCSDPLRPVVTVDGEQVPPLTRASFDWKPGDVPHLYLELMGEGEIQGEGVVIQQVPVPADALEVLDEFFSALDPAELEQAILGEFGAFSETTTGEACIAVMKKWIRRE